MTNSPSNLHLPVVKRMSSNPILDDNDSLLLVLHDENTTVQFPPSPAKKDLFDICSSVNPSLVTPPQFLNPDNRRASIISSNSLTLNDSFDLPLDHGSFEIIGRREVAHSARLVIDEPPVSFTKAYVLACFVFWLCGFVAGSLAYIEAVKGEGSAYDGDTELAHRRRKASYCASIAGISIGLIAIVTTVIVLSLYYLIKY